MEIKNMSYLLILVVTLAIPLILGFIKKDIRFFSKLKYIIPAMFFSGAVFIIWDLRFEERAIWRFNREFVTGINILNLPIEEWLYFVMVPILGIFIYEVVKHRLNKYEKPNLFLALSFILFIFCGIVAYSTRQKLYPFFTFFLLAIYLGYTIFRNRFKKHYTKFYLAYFILLIPFIIMESIKTALPILEYNPDHMLGIKLYTIPVENFAYFFLLFLINVTIYEYLKERQIY